MLSLDLNYKKLKKKGEELCGDTVEIVRDAESTVIVLADGLGSGVKANILVTLTAKIIATMIRNHLGIEEVVKTIVETLPVCRLRGIAYSTFTVVQINAGEEARIEVNLDFPDPTVPPTGNIKGLDLVTEGALTIGKNSGDTARYIRRRHGFPGSGGKERWRLSAGLVSIGKMHTG